jgi:acyl-CoA thioester hydrolase
VTAFVSTEKLRFCDSDSLGHINNAVYAVLCEAGRVDLLRACGLIGGPHVGFAPVIARLELDFLREMTWPGEVRIETEVLRLGGKSFHLRQRLHQGEALVARSHSVLAMLDTAARRAVPLEPAWREVLSHYLVANDAA